jgi:hypothetical protein
MTTADMQSSATLQGSFPGALAQSHSRALPSYSQHLQNKKFKKQTKKTYLGRKKKFFQTAS